jgi:hypothetical protein
VAVERFSLGWAALPLFEPPSPAGGAAGARGATTAEAAAWGGGGPGGSGSGGDAPLLAAPVMAGTPRYLLFR